jgi:UDP-2-acetamido-2-deoxy-ribo-hexuluronate aminotransferase
MKLPFIDLKSQYRALQSSIQSRINTVLEHGHYIMGPEVAEMEERLSVYTKSKHCVSVGSGTDALLISLMALDIRPGDEVITTPFTFIATAEVIVLLGAKPIFVDIELDTGNIDVSLIEEKITCRTKAIIPVSLYGQTCDMDEINAIAARYGNIPVIEDGAQSFGANYKGRRSCNLSTIGCTSFYPSKPLGCYGDGGAIFTNDDGIAAACREIRVHGQIRRYLHHRIGLGGRMDTIQCAVVLAKLDRFDWEIERRVAIGQRYSEIFTQTSVSLKNSVTTIKLPSIRPDRTSTFAQYTIFTSDRDFLQKKLTAFGIPTAIHYPLPINEQPAYKHLCCTDCTPNARTLAAQTLSLPISADLKDATQDLIVRRLLELSVPPNF